VANAGGIRGDPRDYYETEISPLISGDIMGIPSRSLSSPRERRVSLLSIPVNRIGLKMTIYKKLAMGS
jgi:hypothetical protein